MVLVSLYVQKLPLCGSLQLDIVAVPRDSDAVANGSLILSSYYMLRALYLIFPKCHRYILSSRVSDVEDRAEKLCPRSHCRELSELGLGRGLSDSGSWFFTSALGGETLRGRTSGVFPACGSPDVVPGPAVSASLGTLSHAKISPQND